MKESTKKVKGMAKVRNKSFIFLFFILTMFHFSIGKLFLIRGDRYEGGWKEGEMHGQGKREITYFIY